MYKNCESGLTDGNYRKNKGEKQNLEILSECRKDTQNTADIHITQKRK